MFPGKPERCVYICTGEDKVTEKLSERRKNPALICCILSASRSRIKGEVGDGEEGELIN